MAETCLKLDNEIPFINDWSCGYREGYDKGRLDGIEETVKEIKETVKKNAIERYVSKYDLSVTIPSAEKFIKDFYESFPKYSIVSARIGTAPSSSIPTVLFVLDVPEDVSEEEDDKIEFLKRSAEREFSGKNPGHPICIWSVENSICDKDSIESDFPIYRRLK